MESRRKMHGVPKDANVRIVAHGGGRVARKAGLARRHVFRAERTFAWAISRPEILMEHESKKYMSENVSEE